MLAISAETPPPFLRLGPAYPLVPLVIAVPHAGRHYPESLERERGVSRRILEDLEDRYCDRLVGPAIAGGAVAIVATHARAWIDLNRGIEDGGDPAATTSSMRARAGLGLVPTRIAGRALWRTIPDKAEVARRLATVHDPYHAAVAAELAAAQNRHGAAVLIDCHSMPPLTRSGQGSARIVIGDRHGSSAGSCVAEAAVAVCHRHGVAVARNAPYAGAFTLTRHGRPEVGIHAIQLELDRSLYLGPGLREPSDRLEWLADLVAEICSAASASILRPNAEAAE